MDFLGLRNLSDIKQAIELVQKNRGETVEFDNATTSDVNGDNKVDVEDINAVINIILSI